MYIDGLQLKGHTCSLPFFDGAHFPIHSLLQLSKFTHTSLAIRDTTLLNMYSSCVERMCSVTLEYDYSYQYAFCPRFRTVRPHKAHLALV